MLPKVRKGRTYWRATLDATVREVLAGVPVDRALHLGGKEAR